MDLVGQQFGNYVVTKKIGGGGMGSVYLCRHPMLGRQAALKVLHEELAVDAEVVDRFFHEAKAANDIGNQHIVDVLDFGRRDNVVYLLMEFLDGESLGARQQRSPLGRAEALHVIAQCCEALQASHEKGIVHRDLKPENIFLCRRGDDPIFVKIVDFGIAKLLSDPTHQQTRTGMILGTPQYMSPEQCEGKGHIDARTDIYALGVVMFEIFVGRVPFDDEGVGEVMVAHMTRHTPRPSLLRPGLPAAIDAIILHAMEKNPARRFQSMEEMAAALADPQAHLARYQLPVAPTMSQAAPTMHLSSTLSDAAAEVVPAPRQHPHPSFWITALAAIAVVAVGAAAGLGIALSRKPTVVREMVKVPVTVSDPLPMHVTITSTPPGAPIKMGDRVVGRTPLTVLVHDLDEISLQAVPPPQPAPAAKKKQKSPLLMEPVF